MMLPLFRFRQILIFLAMLAALSGCVSVTDVNEAIQRVDRVWFAEYSNSADKNRQRVVDAPYDLTMEAVQRVFADFEMSVVADSLVTGDVVSESDAPKPLSVNEWREIAAEENIRVQEVGAWYLQVSEDPKGYVVQLQAKVRSIDARRTAVILEYNLDNPGYRSMGVTPSKYAPPKAVEVATRKFWRRLGERLSEANAPGPRRRAPDEREMYLEGLKGA
jgi:hypothetical protein